MAYVNIAEWKADQVCEWLKGTTKMFNQPDSTSQTEKLGHKNMSESYSVLRMKLHSLHSVCTYAFFYFY